MKDLNVLFMGSPSFSVSVLEELNKNVNVVGVVTAPDAYVGRKKVLTMCPVKEKAISLGLKVYSPIKLRSDYPYKTALYSGSYELDKDYDQYFDYLKIGPYIPEKKALNFKTTNQRLYEIEREYDPVSFECIKTERKDITYKFWGKD